MNDIANTTAASLSTIERLANEAKLYRASIHMSFMGLARVLAEARPLIPYGQWKAWVAENAEVGEKTAGDMIAMYRRFSGNPRIEGLGMSKILKMLALPAGTEDAFMEEHDVGSMTVRQVQAAVKHQRATCREEPDEEPDGATDSDAPPTEMVDEILRLKRDIAKRDGDIERAKTAALEALTARDEAVRERRNAEAEAEKYRSLFNRQKASYEKVSADLLNLQSAEAKGEAEHSPTAQLSPDAFSAAARAFIAACYKMPTMGTIFATMNPEDWQEYDRTLKSIEKWAADSRRALDPLEGEVIFGV